MITPGEPSPLARTLQAFGPEGTISGHGIIAGFGIPGREVANLFEARGVPFCVIELNPQTVMRCAAGGLAIIEGDAAEEHALRRAGIERAAVLALAIPNDPAILLAIDAARRLNPRVLILARCRRISTAFEATRRGANDVIAEERVIGEAFARQLAPMLLR